MCMKDLRDPCGMFDSEWVDHQECPLNEAGAPCKHECTECKGECHSKDTLFTQAGEMIEVNEKGGKGSYLPVAYQYIPWDVIEAMAEVFKVGSLKYAPDNWKNVTGDSHFNHMMNHLVSDRKVYNKEELSHALCRMVMYYYMRTREQE